MNDGETFAKLGIMEDRWREISTQQKATDEKFDKFREFVSEKFVALRKDLFETPIFVTLDLFRADLESRDRSIADLRRDLEAVKLEASRDEEARRVEKENEAKRIDTLRRENRQWRLSAALAIITAFISPVATIIIVRLANG